FLQSLKPALHEAMPHAPFVHAATPLATVHLAPHDAQLLTSLLVLVSQPLAALASQSLNGGVQSPTPHTPAAQPGVPLAPQAPTLPHAPQWLAFVALSTSQPLASIRSQSRNVPLQLPIAHAPAAHAATPFVTIAQAIAHAPQFLTSRAASTSQP